jgi:hypothetical protein
VETIIIITTLQFFKKLLAPFILGIILNSCVVIVKQESLLTEWLVAIANIVLLLRMTQIWFFVYLDRIKLKGKIITPLNRELP